ncbi:hypothetical protein C8R45DRAFT_628029 [Mycena sanguinolenta]|nr:hypothetical protein C8R45DRAFT_628029 [Mycena sanguinolenta]
MVSPEQHDLTLQLPAEILVDIFDMCSPPGEDGFDGLSDTTTPAREVKRLAKKYLLQLSQVSSRWHVLIMGTPMLWRIIVVDTTLWSESGLSSTTLIGLLATSLNRGAEHPLKLQVAVEDEESHGSEVLALLCGHAQRWQNVHFWSAFSAIQSIATVSRNLPLLEKLEISQTDDWMDFGVFEAAPRLTDLTVTGSAGRVPSVPWAQLQYFRYFSFDPNNILHALALLGNSFSAHARFDLMVYITNTAELPPVLSHVSDFSLTVGVYNNLGREVLGPILDCLSFLRLDGLSLMGRYGDESSLSWDQHRFLRFVSRSSLGTSLTSLEMARTTIDHDELVGCLAVLPSLVQLVISDDEFAPHNLITDSLLQRLIWTHDPATCLVPRLNFVCLTSVLDFCDDKYWEFIASRIVPAQWDGLSLEAKIYWLPVCTRELPPAFFSKGFDLDGEGKINFTARPDPERA